MGREIKLETKYISLWFLVLKMARFVVYRLVTYISSYRKERERYYLNRERARHDPQKYISIIIDGMDQSKTDLPHFATKTKSSSALWTLQTHISGGIVHGRRTFALIDLMLWPHDSNLTINVLLHILLSIAAADTLPAVLYIQFDNCTRENKNKFVLGFLALLVHLGVFKEV